MSTFAFIDRVSEFKKDESLTAFFTLKPEEEFLKDHFPEFPVMPGVLLLESMKQAASELMGLSGKRSFYRLADVEEVKFGQFVKPGTTLKIQVSRIPDDSGRLVFDGRTQFVEGGGRALMARFSLVPVAGA